MAKLIEVHVSIACIVLSYNHPEITLKAVRSALDFFAPEQIFIVHNGSHSAHQKSVINHTPKTCHHLILPLNKGYSGGGNYGMQWVLQNTMHSWMLFITNDCELDQFPMNILTSPPSLIAPLILFRSRKKVDSFGGHVNWKQGKLTHLKNRNMDEISLFNYVPGSAFLIHRSLLKIGHGPFDERLHTYWEDVLWSHELAAQGNPLVRNESFIVLHGGGKTTHHLSEYTFHYFQRNRLAVTLLFLKGFELILFKIRFIIETLILLRKKKLLLKPSSWKQLKAFFIFASEFKQSLGHQMSNPRNSNDLR
jgi:GT2 family glycosyltransferase